ncbi:MAG TPA: serine hydrolase [Victivallales bacterium]|nr:serine hydrolase [Victivallales bacterium]
MKKFTILLIGLITAAMFSVNAATIKHNAPEKTWMQYKTPAEAGWSAEKLKEAHNYFKKIGSSTVMLIYKGKVVVAWGNVDKDMPAASIRKVFLSALYGIYVDKGVINIHDTLQDINFNDKPPLTHSERQATIFDMLTCRSGISRKGANAETQTIKIVNGKEVIIPKYLLPPEAKPGTVYYYSNWNFNALGGIFNQLSDKDLFKVFDKDIAKPIGMQDFSLIDTWYEYNKKVTLYPAYHFIMSTRDMSRFGQLYLNDGNWNGEQLLSKKWVKESTKEYCLESKNAKTGEGYLWATHRKGFYKNHPEFDKAGTGYQILAVFPKDKMVVVVRANFAKSLTDENYKYVSGDKTFKLLQLLVSAKTNPTIKNPTYVPLKSTKKHIKTINLNRKELKSYIGKYVLDKNPVGLKSVIVYIQNKQLIGKFIPLGIKLILLPTSKNHFMISILDVPIKFQMDKKGDVANFTFTMKGRKFIGKKEK